MDRYVKNGFVTQGDLNAECEKLKGALRIKTPNLARAHREPERRQPAESSDWALASHHSRRS